MHVEHLEHELDMTHAAETENDVVGVAVVDVAVMMHDSGTLQWRQEVEF
jgi:hypothetical protein